MKPNNKDTKPLGNGSSIRLIQLPFYSISLENAIKDAFTDGKKTFLTNSKIEVRKLSKKDVVVLLEYEEEYDFEEEEESVPVVENAYILNSRKDAVIKINNFLYKKYYSKYL